MASTDDIIAATLARNVPHTGSIKLFGYDFTTAQLTQLVQYADVKSPAPSTESIDLSFPYQKFKSAYDSVTVPELEQLCRLKQLSEADFRGLAHLYYRSGKHQHLKIVLEYDPNVWTTASKNRFAEGFTLTQFALREFEKRENLVSFIHVLEARNLGIDKQLSVLMREKFHPAGDRSLCDIGNIFLDADMKSVDELQLATLEYLGVSFTDMLQISEHMSKHMIKRENGKYYIWPAIYYFAGAGNLAAVKYCLGKYTSTLSEIITLKTVQMVAQKLALLPENKNYIAILNLLTEHREK